MLPLLISWVQIGEVLRVPPKTLVYQMLIQVDEGLSTSLTRLTGFLLMAMLHMSLDVFLGLQYGFPRTGRAHERERGLYQV